MADIFHHFSVKAPVQEVFQAVSTPAGLDKWWTERSSGQPELGAEYSLWFGPEYGWRATVSHCVPNVEFELSIDDATKDWLGTRVGFALTENEGATQVRFHHTDWSEPNDHYRVSCYCWAMYLRLLKRYVEYGEAVEYEDRLDV